MKTTEVSLQEFWMPESHRPHDVTKVVSREELLLLGVKQVEADLETSGVKNRNITWLYLQTLDFIVGQIGLLIDLLKVNISVGVSFAWIGLDNCLQFSISCSPAMIGDEVSEVVEETLSSQRNPRPTVPLSLTHNLTIPQPYCLFPSPCLSCQSHCFPQCPIGPIMSSALLYATVTC